MSGSATRCSAVFLACWVGACAAVQPVDEPALLVRPSPQTRSELAGFVSAALNGVPARLSDQALTEASVLSIDHGHAVDEHGRALNGRELGHPEIFRLVRAGTRCLLIHERTGRRFSFTEAECAVR
jgi:Rad3-related DNA helicase